MQQLNSIEHRFIDRETGNFSLAVSSLHGDDPSTAPGDWRQLMATVVFPSEKVDRLLERR